MKQAKLNLTCVLAEKANWPNHNQRPLPKCMVEDGELEIQPLDMLEHHYSPQGEVKILVKWKDLPNCKSSWELFTAFKRPFPHFRLEDKVTLDGRVNVRSHIFVFRRKRNQGMKTPGSSKLGQMAIPQMQGSPEMIEGRGIACRNLVVMENKEEQTGGKKVAESSEKIGRD